MAQPVWVLSLDLQTKTATFQSGMSEAAKSARGAFTDIKSGAGEMGGAVRANMFEARHSVMILGEEFGVHLPRALTAFIAGLGPVGAALEAAFPFLAIALGATLFIEHLVKLKAEGVRLTEDQVEFGTAVQTAYNQLDQRLLQAGIRSDELRNDHLGVLRLQLELIDKQSMAELVHSFAEVARAAEVVFGDLQSHWYTFGSGATGAKHALETFQTNYEALLAKGKDKDASDLLKGTRESAEHILAMQKQAASAQHPETQRGGAQRDPGDKYAQAMAELNKANAGYTKDNVGAQEALVEALKAQEGIEQRINALKSADSGNASAATGKEIAALRAEGERQAAEHSQKMGELMLAAQREQAQVGMTLQSASIAERLANDVHLADEEYRIQLAANGGLIQALDKGSKDYENRLKAAQDKVVELTQQHENTVAALRGKATQEQYAKDVADLESGEREKINATEQGSAARLAAINAAIKEEQSRNLDSTQHYRELMQERVAITRQFADEEAKIQGDLGKEEAENAQKMGELAVAAEREHTALLQSARRMTIQMRLADEMDAANKEYALKLTTLQREAQALDKGGKDYLVKLRELQNKEKQLVQAHENEITSIKDKAEMDRNTKILSAEDHFNDAVAAGLTQVLMGHKSFASMMGSLGNQVISGMMENAIKSLMISKMTQESAAVRAASDAYANGEAVPLVGPVLGPIWAAAAFAGVMAFQDGGIVPGVGSGDIVPAMLEPGEGVVKKSAMDRLNRGEVISGGTTHVMHYRPTFHVQTIDRTGVQEMLDKHQEAFSKHFQNEVRKSNR